MDFEKAHLLEERCSISSEPLIGMFTGAGQAPPSSSTEGSEDGSSVLWRPDGHCHEINDTPSRALLDEKRSAKRKLLAACAVSLLFVVGELIGGYAAQSLAIMTDAAHLLTDFGSIVISVFSLWISTRPPTKTMTFGWHRAEAMGALLSILSIWALTGVLVFLAGQRILSDDYEIDTHVMLLTSGFAVGANILMALILHQPNGSDGAHSHGLPRPPACRTGEKRACGVSRGQGSSTSVRAAFIHALGDLLHSVGVLLAATVIHFRPELKVADPICTFLFSILVLGTTFAIIKDVCRTLMEGTPRGVSLDAVKETLLSVRGVRAVHDLHAWSLSASHSLVSVHVAVEESANTQVVLRELARPLASEFGFSSITVQVENLSEDMLDCRHCRDLTD